MWVTHGWRGPVRCGDRATGMKGADMTMQSIPTPSGPMTTGYLLIDPSNLDEETFAEALPMIDCVPAALSQSANLMPRLIDVAALSPAQKDGLSQVMSRELSGERPPIVCAWIECAQDVKSLVRNITRFLVGPGAAGTTVYWRYFDPRVFAVAIRAFSPDQTHVLLGAIAEWRFPWCHRWWSVVNSGGESDNLLGIGSVWPTQKQWCSFENSALTAGVMAKLFAIEEKGSLCDDTTCLRLLGEIDMSLLNARKNLSLHDHDEMGDYAFYSVLYGQRFQLHPKLTTAWDELAEGRLSWTELVSMLDADDYRQLDEFSEIRAMLRGVENDLL